ncbi:MAG: molybdopterin-dependent oxidoreductase [Betaproteobacteria bacterium]|nr:molybdopterin-dependent oxidoreductase [Betaproteobacteria bacterium]
MATEVKSTCPYCGVGCGVIIEADGNHISGVRGDPDHPANFGRLCTKGSTLHLTVQPDARALYPELRARREEARERASWDEALEFAAEKFAGAIRSHGPDSVAFYISGQLLTEDYYVFNKLAKGLIGTNNVDTNSRLCMSSAVTGYKLTLGADAPPACYEDIDHAECLFIAGSNTAYAHPIVFRRIEDARARNPELKLIVVDPRRTDTAAVADLHLAILPGTDVALFNAILHVLLWEGLCNLDYIRAHTEGFDAVKNRVADYTPKTVAQICGVSAEDIVQAARWFGRARATLSLYCQGLNQSTQGTEKNAALINLHLATGQIGRPGAGPFSLTGQPNAMGGREVGGMATLLSGHRDLANPAHREEIARFWGVDSVPSTPGKSAVEMFEAVRTGEIKAIWIACTNPVQSMPNQALVAQALKRAECVVVQEAFAHTDTTPFADVLLPATTWGDKEGTVTNSERCISRVRAAVPPPGGARHDWQIAVDFALRLGRKLERADAPMLFSYCTPEQIFNEHRETTRGRDLDVTGLSYQLLESRGPQQWPFPVGAATGKARLYEDGVFATPGGRARFMDAPYRPVAEKTDARYPLHLNTGRLRDQWHGMSRTGIVARLFNHAEEPLLAMNPTDMQRRGLLGGDIVRVKSRRGEIRVRVQASEEVRPAQVYLPMHWGAQFMRGGGINTLTVADFDPVSMQPELKHAAVQVEKLDCRWQLVAMRSGDVLKYLHAVQPLLERFAYASCGLYGREHPLLLFRAACAAPAEDELIAALDVALELSDDACAMVYRDARRGICKRVLVQGEKVVGARLTGETAARDWLRDLMAQNGSAQTVRPWILAPVASPPLGQSSRGRIVCNCLDVSEREIEARVAAGATLAQLQAQLKCGTSCGSCLPELRRMAQQARAAA